ncbi:MAG: DUF4330 family protein [Clostridia bacterium]|nr:DUF4330 family protein [Clostridia bacterium]MBO4428566.1 DUF4330 family protein [Clostridia bacterium]
MDKNVRKKQSAKLNIIDIIIIFAVLACIAAIGLRIYFTSQENKYGETASVTFEVYGISEENAAAFAQNAKLYLASSDREIGYISAFTTSPATVDAVGEGGEMISVNDPFKVTVVGTATLKGKWNGSGFYLDGTTLLSLGTNVEVYTEKNIFSLTVLGVSKN